MTAGIWFWILYVISFLFTGYWWWPFNAERGPFLLLYILIGLLGWGIFRRTDPMNPTVRIRWPSWCARIEQKLDRTLINQENIMATLQDVLAAEAQAKTEMDAIAAGVTSLVASNAALATQLAAAIASTDPVQLQAALDAANALVTEGQAVVASLPAPAPGP